MKMQEGILDHPNNSLLLQHASACFSVRIFFQLSSSFPHIFNLQQLLPFPPPRCRHGILQSKRDKLDEISKIRMRHVATLMPARKTERLFFPTQLPF